MNVGWVLDKALEYLGSPFVSWASFVHASSGLFLAAVDLKSKTAWPYLLSSLAIAWLVWASARRQGLVDRSVSFRRYAIPRTVYFHRSAIADYKFVAVDLTIQAVLYTPLITGISQLVHRPLALVITPIAVGELPFTSSLVRSIVMAVLTVALADFVFFFAHFSMHRVPILWHFHETHHSAETLTPVTVYRVHPVESLVNGIAGAIASACIVLPYEAHSGTEPGVLTFYGVNSVLFVFFLVAFQLRHSHIWLSYGPVLSRIFISPAQHQIHHSVDPKHWNKNYGFTFAIWDLLFRSLYVPKTHEVITFGVPGSDPDDFATVWKIYWLPFVKAFRAIRRQPPSPARLLWSAQRR